MYKRKTFDVYEIHGLYGNWECVSPEANYKDAKNNLKLYRDNERGIAFKIVKKRVRYESLHN